MPPRQCVRRSHLHSQAPHPLGAQGLPRRIWRQARREVPGVERILFSTRHPYVLESYDGARQFLSENAPLSDLDRSGIAYATWKRLCLPFGIDRATEMVWRTHVELAEDSDCRGATGGSDSPATAFMPSSCA
jgi:hypothetical protein